MTDDLRSSLALGSVLANDKLALQIHEQVERFRHGHHLRSALLASLFQYSGFMEWGELAADEV